MAMQPRRRAPAARWLAAAALVLIAAGCTPQSATEQGPAIYGLYNCSCTSPRWSSCRVGLVVWSVDPLPARDDELPTQTHGNNRLELAWTVIPR
jgi:heme/copper-type cytochrome/quinol oxidase subunit 2